MNPAAKRILGQVCDDAAERTIADMLVGQDVVSEVVNQLMDHLAAGENWSSELPFELALSSKGGIMRLVEVSTSPLKGVRDETLGAVIAIRDVTEKTQLQKEIADSQKTHVSPVPLQVGLPMI